jgi:hypothetical protein
MFRTPHLSPDVEDQLNGLRKVFEGQNDLSKILPKEAADGFRAARLKMVTEMFAALGLATNDSLSTSIRESEVKKPKLCSLGMSQCGLDRDS